MELDLQVYFDSCVQLYSLAELENPQLPPSPRIWDIINLLGYNIRDIVESRTSLRSAPRPVYQRNQF